MIITNFKMYNYEILPKESFLPIIDSPISFSKNSVMSINFIINEKIMKLIYKV